MTVIETFGFRLVDGGHHFSVVVPLRRTDPVRIVESHRVRGPGLPLDIAGRECAVLTMEQWERIAPYARHEFNGRLRNLKKRCGSWRKGEHLIPPHFGKELVVLAWAVEDLVGDALEVPIRNWLGLSPEERWWLFTTAHAGNRAVAAPRERGWRPAIKVALGGVA